MDSNLVYLVLSVLLGVRAGLSRSFLWCVILFAPIPMLVLIVFDYALRREKLVGLAVCFGVLLSGVIIFLVGGIIRLCSLGIRAGKGQCPSCGFGFTGHESGVCPECGFQVPVPELRSWRKCPHLREEMDCIIRSAMADLCQVPPESILPSATIQSLWQMQSDGGGENRFIEMLEQEFRIRIDERWWQSEVGGETGYTLTFDEFAHKLGLYVERKLTTCGHCGHDLRGHTAGISDTFGICPECGGRI